jgi:Mce-associated membrane protein
MSESTDERVAGARPGWWRTLLRPGRFAVFVVVLLLAAATAYLGVRAYTLSRQATDLAVERAEALSDASRYAVDLTSYDYRHLDTAFAVVAGDSTPAFASRYRAASATRADQLRSVHSVSAGTVVAAGIQDETVGRTADVLVLVNQSVTNTSTPKSQTERNELRITLARSGDRWLISDLVLL